MDTFIVIVTLGRSRQGARRGLVHRGFPRYAELRQVRQEPDKLRSDDEMGAGTSSGLERPDGHARG